MSKKESNPPPEQDIRYPSMEATQDGKNKERPNTYVRPPPPPPPPPVRKDG